MNNTSEQKTEQAVEHENKAAAETTTQTTVTTKKESAFSKPWVQSLSYIVVIFGLLGAFLYWQAVRGTVYIEFSHLEAPVANMSTTAAGVLNAVYVKEGDRVFAGQQLALVGSETLYAKNDGIIASAPKVVGAYFTPGQTIVSVVADKQMQVVGTIDENDGLDKVASGQPVTFTVDTFSGKKYEGFVDKVSVTSDDTGVIFSISDKRPIKKFSVFVNFDTSKYPELKSGMSAKITVRTRI